MGFLEGIFMVVVFIYSVVLHEVSHGIVAHSMGDNTAKDRGRITLNPLKHLDWFGSVLLPLLTYKFGGLVFGYAKPVPYNPANLNDQKYGPAKVAIAGPAVNLVLALLFGLLYRFLHIGLQDSILPKLFYYIAYWNIGLAVFNLMPIPPLDGHWLLFTLLPQRFVAFRVFLLRYSLLFFFIFLIFIFPILLPLIDFLFRIIVGV